MNEFIKKTVISYKKRGLYNRKMKIKNGIKMQDLMDLYISKNWSNKINITTYKNN